MTGNNRRELVSKISWDFGIFSLQNIFSISFLEHPALHHKYQAHIQQDSLSENVCLSGNAYILSSCSAGYNIIVLIL